jgi:hypothetical protein
VAAVEGAAFLPTSRVRSPSRSDCPPSNRNLRSSCYLGGNEGPEPADNDPKAARSRVPAAPARWDGGAAAGSASHSVTVARIVRGGAGADSTPLPARTAMAPAAVQGAGGSASPDGIRRQPAGTRGEGTGTVAASRADMRTGHWIVAVVAASMDDKERPASPLAGYPESSPPFPDDTEHGVGTAS